MKRITPEDPESRSPDLVADNVAQLARLFPEAFTEGKVSFAVLRELLGDAVEESEEKFGLSWHGKRRARRLALTPSSGTLRPCPEESVAWESTQNLMIEGDNLEVLKLLQKSYTNKVKLIYIDPPYNTGKDFVYRDNYKDGIRSYLEITGQLDGDGDKLCSNTDASGRFHTNWLNMMYPRLKAARNLLRQDGIIAVSIDEEELSNLQKMMDEILGDYIESYPASRSVYAAEPGSPGAHWGRSELIVGVGDGKRLHPRLDVGGEPADRARAEPARRGEGPLAHLLVDARGREPDRRADFGQLQDAVHDVPPSRGRGTIRTSTGSRTRRAASSSVISGTSNSASISAFVG